MAAIGQAGEVQRLQQPVLDQPRQIVMRRHGDVDAFAAVQGLVQFFGGAVGVVFDADPAAFLEFVEHRGGDVVVPVVDADQVFGMAEQRSESEEQQGGQAWHWHFSLYGKAQHEAACFGSCSDRLWHGDAMGIGPGADGNQGESASHERPRVECRFGFAPVTKLCRRRRPAQVLEQRLTPYADTSCTRGRRSNIRTPASRAPCTRRRCRCTRG
ncbi:hypothetical protein D3C81_776920 [compost metagenome]